MFCTNCGKKIPDDSKFCEYCGEKFTSPSKGKKTIPVQNDTKNNDNKLSNEEVYQVALIISEAKHAANRMILGGVGWIIAGIVITGITYAMSEPGGTYFIFWGLSLYGVYRLIKGLYYRMMPQKLIKDAFGRSKDDGNEKESSKETKKESSLHWE